MSDLITHEFWNPYTDTDDDVCQFRQCRQPRSAHAKLSDQHSHLLSDDAALIAEARRPHYCEVDNDSRDSNGDLHERLAAVTRERDAARADVDAVSRAFVVEMPQPGTDLARVMLFNQVLTREREALRAELTEAKASVSRWAGAAGKAHELVVVQLAAAANERDAALAKLAEAGREREALKADARALALHVAAEETTKPPQFRSPSVREIVRRMISATDRVPPASAEGEE